MNLQIELTVNPNQRTHPMTTFLVAYSLINLCLGAYGCATA